MIQNDFIIKPEYINDWKPTKTIIEGFGLCEISGFSKQGKTRTMVAAAFNEIVSLENYKPEKTLSTVAIPPLGILAVTKECIVDFVDRMVDERFEEWLLLIDEADQVFPHREYASKRQKDVVINFHQLAKLGSTCFYTIHQGLGVDKIMREATFSYVIPKKELPGQNYQVCDVLNINYGFQPFRVVYGPLDLIHQSYTRRQPVV